MTQPDVPEPTRGGVNPVRWPQVLAGFGIGAGVAWGLRLSLFALVSAGPGGIDSVGGVLFAAMFPTVVLVATILWAARTGRKAWAIGMAIYAGVGGLLVGGTGLAVFIACSGGLKL